MKIYVKVDKFFSYKLIQKIMLKILIVIIGMVSPSIGFVGNWHSYTNREHVACMQPYGGRLFVGTSGGIRNINPATFEEKSYTNLNGLIEVSIVAMAVSTSNQLWAASRSGFLYQWDGSAWQVYGRSYVAERWRPNLRAMISMGKYLAIGTAKGVTFFDLEKKAASVNLNKFYDKTNVSVLSLLQKGDSLFIGTEVGVYKTAIDPQNILSSKYQSIFDPKSWIPVNAKVMAEIPKPKPVVDSTNKNGSDSSITEKKDTIPNPYRFMVFHDTTIETYPQGMVQYSPLPIKVLFGAPMEIAEKEYKNLVYFDQFVQIGNTLFLAGPDLMSAITNFDQSTPTSFYFNVLSNSELPLERVFNVVSVNKNTYALTQYELYRKNNQGWDRDPKHYVYSEETESRSLRNLAIDSKGNAYIGSWGLGLFKITDDRSIRFDVNNTPCMDTAFKNFTVIQAESQVYKNGLWSAIFKAEKAQTYELVFLDIESGKTSCPILSAKGNTVRHIKVLSDDVVAVAGDAGTDLYTYDRSGEIKMTPWKNIRLDGASESWDAEMDGFGRVWTLIAGQLLYVDSLEQSGAFPKPKSIENFNGKDCRQIEKDINATFWIGCSDGLYHFSPALLADASQSKHFTLDDGLLSNTITDVSVNKENGQVWLATDLGISMYESDVRPLATGVSNIKAYPNPFRAMHRVVAIDPIPQGMAVSIYAPSGNVVRRFTSEMIKGGQCQWDGTNFNGAKVSPGIYNYSVEGPGKSAQGKIIVAR